MTAWETIQRLETLLPQVPLFRQDFARSLISQAQRKALSEKQMFWVNKIVSEALAPPPPAPAAAQIGNLAGIMALFDKAKQHLKFPAIVMSVPATATTSQFLVRINVAGPNAKFPGTLNVTSGEKPELGERRNWYGRVMLNGNYEPAHNLDDKVGLGAPAAMTARLVEFAANPARVASEHGRLTGRCCFCNLALSDERSTAVGYGKICAGHYGLPWGERE